MAHHDRKHGHLKRVDEKDTKTEKWGCVQENGLVYIDRYGEICHRRGYSRTQFERTDYCD